MAREVPRASRPTGGEPGPAGSGEGRLTDTVSENDPKRIRERALRTLAAAGAQPGQPLHILEVGSWLGASAILWARAIEELGGQGDITCVDPWLPYQGETEPFDKFTRNVAEAGVAHFIRVRRGTSDAILPTLSDEGYDLVYVDGDHSYAQVKSDIEHAMPLVRPGGILGGDDLEVLFGECNQAFALKWAEIGAEYERDPATNLWFHPGVTVAVQACIGTVWRKGLTWGVRKTANGWSPAIGG
jgi:hypothetical protein